MGAELSRHIGKLMKYVPLCDISLEDRLALGEAADSVDTVAELPEKLRQMVIQAEDKQLPPSPLQQAQQQQ